MTGFVIGVFAGFVVGWFGLALLAMARGDGDG